MRTGIAPCDWERSGYRHIATAVELIQEQDEREQRRGGRGAVLSVSND